MYKPIEVFTKVRIVNNILECVVIRTKGLEKLSNLIEKWKSDPKTYSPVGMRSCLDDFQPVLFQHLDEEVR